MFQIRASHKSLGLFFLREFQLPSQRPEVSTSVGQLFRDFQLQTQHSLTAPCILNARQCRGTPPDGTLHGVAGIGAARAAGIGALPRRVVAVALHLAAVCLNRRAPRRGPLAFHRAGSRSPMRRVASPTTGSLLQGRRAGNPRRAVAHRRRAPQSLARAAATGTSRKASARSRRLPRTSARKKGGQATSAKR